MGSVGRAQCPTRSPAPAEAITDASSRPMPDSSPSHDCNLLLRVPGHEELLAATVATGYVVRGRECKTWPTPHQGPPRAPAQWRPWPRVRPGRVVASTGPDVGGPEPGDYP